MPLVLDADMRLDNTLDGEYGTLQYFSDYHSYTGPMTITPTDEDQVLETQGLLMLDNLTVEAIPGDAVGADIPRQDSSSLEVVGPRVTAPAGYYAADVGATVQSGTAGTPVATKGAVSNHSVTVTPSVTNQTGWITGSTKTGTVVTVTADELVSGSQTVTENDTYDVTNLAELVVDVAGHGLLQTKSVSYTPTTSQQTDTILPDDGYDGMDEVDVTIAAVATGSVTIGNRSASSGATITVNSSTGALSAETSVTVPIVPTVEAGYVSSVDSGSVTVTVTGSGQLSTQAAATITPTESQQTAVAAGKYTLGNVNVAAIPGNYVGSSIPRRDVDDVELGYDNAWSVDGREGYYAEAFHLPIPSGQEGSPIIPTPTVVNHSVTIEPYVTNVSGYINGGTHYGDDLVIAASDLVSGTRNITGEGLYDVTNYQYAEVAIDDSVGVVDMARSFQTVNNVREYVLEPYYTTYVAGMIDTGTKHPQSPIVLNVVPANTVVTPTKSQQTLGGYEQVMEGAVTIAPIPNQYIDVSDTTATADRVEAGYYFYTAQGVRTPGTLINGNNTEYGFTDGTIPRAGIAKAGYAELGE